MTQGTREALRWAGWAALSFPLAVLSHEAAHYLSYVAFGFTNPVLHYGSAGYGGDAGFWDLVGAGDLDAAARILPPWQAGAAAGAGLAATYLTIILCCWLVRRKPHPFLFGLGLVAPLRFLGSLFVVVATLLGRRGKNGSDEQHFASIFGFSEFILQLLGVAVLILTWTALLRAVPAPKRLRTLALIAGVLGGGVVYILGVGPLLLP